jgi:hypothetical protein
MDWPVIFSYSRADAIADGVLVDVSAVAREHGFTIPVALTSGVWGSCVEWTERHEEAFKGYGQTEAARLCDVLSMAFVCALQNSRSGSDTCYFKVNRIDGRGTATAPTPVNLKLHIGPGDTVDPALTVMLPEED